MKIGIDAGGTKTKAELFDNNHKIAEVLGPMGNPVVDYAQAMLNVMETIEQLLTSQHLQYTDIDAISIGMAGASTLLEKLETDFADRIPCPVYVDSDLKMSHIATFHNRDGILVIAGTGSAVLARTQQQFSQKGGWGHILGDEGSGYWIGLQILKAYVHYLDFGEMPEDFPALLPALKQQFPDRQAIIHTVYKEAKTEVARLALYTVKFPTNQFLANLCHQAGIDLAKALLACSSESHIQVAFEGSILKNNHAVLHSFKQFLAQQQRTITIVPSRPATESILYF